jgi:hypothetical protein
MGVIDKGLRFALNDNIVNFADVPLNAGSAAESGMWHYIEVRVAAETRESDSLLTNSSIGGN